MNVERHLKSNGKAVVIATMEQHGMVELIKKSVKDF